MRAKREQDGEGGYNHNFGGLRRPEASLVYTFNRNENAPLSNDFFCRSYLLFTAALRWSVQSRSSTRLAGFSYF